MRWLSTSALVLLVAGFSVWSAAFAALYALQALGCAYGWGAWHRPVLIATYAMSLMALGALCLIRPAPADAVAPLWTSAIWANRAALAAGTLVFLPVTFASACL